MSKIITIDGPAASGKTSVSRELAQRLGWSWVSTGAFYRGIAFIVIQSGAAPEDESAVTELIDADNWKVCMGSMRTEFLYKGKDVTEQIYMENIGSIASVISQHPRVRSSLLEAQRACANDVEGLVAEGRDCGTVVFPDANVKIYLTARSQSRAERRALEQGADVGQTQEAQKLRDQQDSNRATAPLQVPPEALVVDTSDMDLQQVTDHIANALPERMDI